MPIYSLLLLASIPTTGSDVVTSNAPDALVSTAPVSESAGQKSPMPLSGQKANSGKEPTEARAPSRKNTLKAVLGVIVTVLGASIL